jgi:hypothetical protein
VAEGRVVWEVYKTVHGVISCEISDHPLGWEIRCALNDQIYYSRVHTERSAAEAEADERKHDLLAGGWTELTSMPD